MNYSQYGKKIPNTPLPTTINSVEDMFSHSQFTTIPNVLFDNIDPNGAGMNFKSAFSYAKITSIPSDLFVKDFYNVPASNLEGTFYQCTNITGAVPELWNIPEYQSINHMYCFRGCVNASNYSSIPSDWK